MNEKEVFELKHGSHRYLSRPIAATLVSAGLLTFGAFGGMASANAKAAPTTLVMYSANPAAVPYYRQLLKPFEAEHNVNVKIIAVASSSFMQVFDGAVTAHQPIDVMDLNGQNLQYLAKEGIVQNLTSSMKPILNRFRSAALNTYIIKGKVWALPFGSMSTSGLYYNTTIFSKYHLKVPHTFRQLVADAKVLKSHNIIPIGFGGESIYMWPMWFFQTFAQTTHDHPLQQTTATLRGKVSFTAPEYVQAMNALAQFSKDGLFETGVNGVNSTGGEALFTDGKAAMFYGGSWELSTFLPAEKTGLRFSVAPFPLVTRGVNFALPTGGSGGALAIYSKIAPSHEKLAQELLNYVTTDTFQKKLTVDTSGIFSGNKGVVGLSNPVVEKMNHTLLPKTVTFLDWIWPPQIVTAFQENIQGVIGGQETAKAAMEKIEATYKQLVATGYRYQ